MKQVLSTAIKQETKLQQWLGHFWFCTFQISLHIISYDHFSYPHDLHVCLINLSEITTQKSELAIINLKVWGSVQTVNFS